MIKKFEVIVFTNKNPRCFVDGWQPEHELTRNRGKFMFLGDVGDKTYGLFDDTSQETWIEVAEKMFAVGNREGEDMKFSTWPSNVRSISTGDVIRITRLDTGEQVTLSCDREGWTRIDFADLRVGAA